MTVAVSVRSWYHGRDMRERYQARLFAGMTLSLLIHAFVLSLQFGAPGLGFPSLELPWHERRARTEELDVRLAGAQGAPGGAARTEEVAPPAKPIAAEPDSSPSAPHPSSLRVWLVPAPVIPRPSASLKKPNSNKHQGASRAKAQPRIIARKASGQTPFVMPVPAPADVEQTMATESVTPLDQVKETTEPPASAATTSKVLEVPVVKTVEPVAPPLVPAEEDTRRALDLAAQKQAEQVARQQTEAMQLQKQVEQKREEETARHARELAAMRLAEAKKQDEAKAERQALELAARTQAEETARQQAVTLARQMQIQKQADELAVRRQAEAVAAQQRERERLAADSVQAPASGAAAGTQTRETPGLPHQFSGGDLAGKALAQARAPDASRNVPALPQPPAGIAESPSRRSVFGSANKDIGVTMYIESWRLKIERNGSLNYRQSAREKSGDDPVVTVVVRSDGNVEDIVINRSSGRPELDEAVRRIVRLNARYSAFPSSLARKYDAIEIRRVWNFDDTLRIQEEVR